MNGSVLTDIRRAWIGFKSTVSIVLCLLWADRIGFYIVVTLFCIACLLCEVIGSDISLVQHLVQPELEISDNSLNITHDASSVDSITLSWIVLDSFADVDYFKVQWYSLPVTYDKPVTSTQPLTFDTTSYEIRNLQSNSEYQICVIVQLATHTGLGEYTPSKRRQCLAYSTIPVVRYQDLLVLACVVGYLLLMCIIGFLCWARARRSFLRRYEDQCEDEDEANQRRVANGSDTSSYVRTSSTAGARLPEYPEKPLVLAHTDRVLSANSASPYQSEHRDIPYIDDERRETKRLL